MVIEINKLSADVPSSSFDCGNQSINNLISRSYYPTILHQAYAFCVSNGDAIIAYYMLKFVSIDIGKCPDEISEFYEDSFEPHLCAVNIEYIAVDKKYQGYHFGTYILQQIITDVQNLCEYWPVRFITLDALTTKIDWYKTLGFKEFKPNNDSSSTVRMYLDCASIDLIHSYVDMFC